MEGFDFIQLLGVSWQFEVGLEESKVISVYHIYICIFIDLGALLITLQSTTHEPPRRVPRRVHCLRPRCSA